MSILLFYIFMIVLGTACLGGFIFLALLLSGSLDKKSEKKKSEDN